MGRGGGPDFCLLILQQLDKRANQLLLDDSLAGRFGQADKFVGDHIPNAPALVGNGTADRIEHVLFGLFRAEVGGNGNEVGDGEQSDRVLVVGRQFAVQRQDIVDERVVLLGLFGHAPRVRLWRC